MSAPIFVGSCLGCGTGFRRDNLPHLHTSVQIMCDVCPNVVVVTLPEVKGTLGKGRCDARCTSSKTRYCSCQCGGRNHGADHAWTVGHGFAAQVVSS